MKELLLVIGLVGTITLIATAVSKWGTAQKLKGITGKVGHLDISFWWRLIAILLVIGIAIALWPEISEVPWKTSKTATILGGLLLLGLLIQWARQEKKNGEGSSLLKLAGFVLLIAAGLWGLWWVYKAANTIPGEYSGQGRVLYAPVPPPVPQPPPTWHGLTGGIERTVTVTGDVSEEIRIALKHEITWDDFYPAVLIRVNKTNVMDLFSGVRTNTIKFETVEFKSKDGVPVTMKVATGLPQ